MDQQVFARRFEAIPMETIAERLQHLLVPHRTVSVEQRAAVSAQQRQIWLAKNGGTHSKRSKFRERVS